MRTLALLILGALAAFAANTTVTDTIYDSGLSPVRGKLYVTPSQQWTCSGGGQVYPREREINIGADGVFTVSLCPTDTATPSGVYYSVRFVLTNSRTVTETWTVPTSGSPIGLTSVRTSPTPSPSVSGYITSLNGLNSVTQLFARTNDTNVTLTITSATSTHTFAMGWTGQLAASRGGTGAGALTTGSVPFIGSSGVYSQDNARLFWDNTNHRLGLGTSSPVAGLDVVSQADNLSNGLALRIRASDWNANGGYLILNKNSANATWATIQAGDTADFRPIAMNPSGGDVLLGGTTDGNFKLDVQSSGSVGTFRVYDQTPSTGATQFSLRNGAGQGVANLALWQDSLGNTMGGIGAGGDIFSVSANKRILTMFQDSFLLGSGAVIGWKNVTGLDDAGAFDTCLYRGAASILSVQDCSSGMAKLKLLGGISTATTAYDSDLANSTCAFPILTSNTNLQLRCKGSDGVVRHADISLIP